MRIYLSIAAMLWAFVCALFVALASGCEWGTANAFICSIMGVGLGHAAFAVVWTSDYWRSYGR